MKKYKYALIGAAGYIAPRHMKAIKDTGGVLIAAMDPSDSVGIIDSYFPGSAFFTEFERFDRHLEKLRRRGEGPDYVIVCSPNYLHDAHIRFGLRLGADVICEKPIVLNPWNIDGLQEIEQETGKRVYNILQLRLHPSVIALKERIHGAGTDVVHDIDLTYLTSRGLWYYASWKGELKKSGGIATNIGVHFYDMLMWIFGEVQDYEVHIHAHDRAAGFLQLAQARVRWFLSINYDVLPEALKEKGLRTYRSLMIGDDEFEFSGGFTELHTRSYEEIHAGRGFGMTDSLAAIQLVHDIRNAPVVGKNERSHELVTDEVAGHPFDR